MTFERDVMDVTDRPRQLDELARLLRAAAARIGGIFDLTSIGGGDQDEARFGAPICGCWSFCS
ncbi:MAG TPA: hypothetical protein VIC05_05855 [Solirubrobacteraceae bacterium]|jgi:hypothetical protein